MMLLKRIAAALAVACFCLPSVEVLAQTPPPNDHCEDVTPGTLAVGGNLVFSGNNEAATLDGDNVPGSGLAAYQSAVVWEAFTTSECANIHIAFCGSEAPFLDEYFWNVLTQQCPADELVLTFEYNNNECPDGQPAMYFNDLPAGTYYYPVWADVNGPHGNYVITVTATACTQAVDAGPDQALCSPADSTMMAAVVPTAPAMGVWTIVAGSANIADSTNPGTQVTGLGLGETVLEWTVDDGAGTFTSDQVSIFLYDGNAPAADAGPDQELCLPADSTVLAANAASYPATGMWTMVSGSGTIADSLAPNTEVEDLGVGEHIFAWTVDNGPCANGNTSDTVRILIYDGNAPAADAGPDQELTLPLDSTVLAANAALFPATGQWILVSGSGSFAHADSANTAVAGLAIGVNTFRWTIFNGPCGTTEDEVSITVSATDTAIITISVGDTVALAGNNAGAVDSLGLGFACAWQGFMLDECATVTVDFCATDESFLLFASGLYSEVPGGTLITADSTGTCANSATVQYFGDLEAGTYWIPVLMDPDSAFGDYVVTVSAAACSTSGIEAQGGNAVGVYPNPTTGSFTVVPAFTATHALITVRDLAGRTMYQDRASLVAGQGHQLHLRQELKAGTYLLEITHGAMKSIARLMVN